METRLMFILALLAGMAPAGGLAAAEDFVRVDGPTGLFTGPDGLFHMLSVTYVQPTESRPGANAGPITVLDFDFTKIRPDFRQMRDAGVNAIYMRVAAGTFLTPDGAWRKLDDPLHGVRDPEAKRADLDRRLAEAATAGLEPFASAAADGRVLHAYEVFDYLLDCAEAEGILVVPMICDNWGMPRKYDLEEVLQSMAYPEVWRQVVADWRKIVGRWRDRTVIAGYLIEGETHHLSTWDETKWEFMGPDGPAVVVAEAPIEHNEPVLRGQFQDYLRWKYGTVDRLKAAWGSGYDRESVAWDEDTGIPRYPYGPEAFDGIASFSDIDLPAVERTKGGAGPGIADSATWWLNVPFDPVWTDFGYFKSWLYKTRLAELMDALREVSPGHLHFHNAAWDNVATWHPFYVTWALKRLPFDVVLHGHGYSKAIHAEPFDIPYYETVQELYHTVGPYRPAALSRGRAFGMGEGNWALESSDPKAKHLEVGQTREDRWTTKLLMDNFGSGAAYANIWDWGVLVGSTPSVPELHGHEVVDTMRTLMAAIEGRTFTRQGRARVLVLMNGPTLHGNMKNLAYDNAVAMASMLASTHRAFDMATTDEVTIGHSEERIDVDAYDVILMPQQFHVAGPQLSRAQHGDVTDVWGVLESWLSTRPDRVLCVGLVGERDSFSNPLDALPAPVAAVLGGMAPEALRKAGNDITVDVADGGTQVLPVQDIFVQTIDLSQAPGAEPWLTRGQEVWAARRTLDNGSRVVLCGFPLGFSWVYLGQDPLSGAGRADRDRTEQATPLYAGLLDSARVAPDYDAPAGVLAYVSDDGEVLLLRKRYDEGDREVTVGSGRLAAGVFDHGVSTVTRAGDATGVRVTCQLPDNLACIAATVARLELLDDGTTTATAAPDSKGAFVVTVTGDVAARLTPVRGEGPPLELAPGTHEVHLP